MHNYTFKSSKLQTYKVNKSSHNIAEQQPIFIFWTGGWDSSFRMLQLSSKDVIIQPIYLDDNRISTDNELRATDAIANLIGKLKTTKCTILDLKILKTSDVNDNEDISNSYNTLLDKQFMGSQYDWLARFAKDYIGIELCIHKDDKAHKVIETFGSDKKIEDTKIGNYYVLNMDLSDEDLRNVFGNYHFPLLHMTKLDMKHEAEINGYIDILNKSWFCFSPINDEPCGLCNPCMYSIEEGMIHRFSKSALMRYKTRNIRKVFKKFKYNIREKISVSLKKLHLLDFVKKIRNNYFTE